MEFRHEWKHEINMADMLALRQSIKAIMKADEHSTDARYEIRSLYFDSPGDKALREKIDGVNEREKFRIRLYNGDSAVVRLEKKSKLNGLCKKQGVIITPQQAQSIINGENQWMAQSVEPLILELYSKIKSQGLRAKTVVDYTREAYTYPAGNVRVTLDYNIRTGLHSTDLFNDRCPTFSPGDSPIILEVKWDAFLPDIIRDAVALKGRRSAAFSKYALCRIYG